jgi:hypothetical protein
VTALRKYTDWRAWLRHSLRGSVHAGIGAVLATFGTNAAENLAPTALAGLGLDWRQLIGLFLTAGFVEALRRLHAATADTTPPIPQ